MTSAAEPQEGTRKALSPPALRAFFRIAELWQLSIAEQMILLGVTARSTFFKWKKNADVELPRDTLERISYLLGIYKALQILLPDPHAADAWVRRQGHWVAVSAHITPVR